MMARSRPILHHDAGVDLYRPTSNVPSYRLVWRDPLTATRSNRRIHDRETAEAEFERTVEYVKGALTVAPSSTPGKRSAPTVDDLFEQVVRRWQLKDRNARYIEKRKGIYSTWVKPTCGSLTVLAWGATDEHCLAVLSAARQAGRAPATIQNIGALLRLLVTTAHERRLLPRSLDPMSDVEYVSGRQADDEAAVYVPPSDRPTTAMVEGLVEQLGIRGQEDGREWLPLMAKIAAYGGLRFGELTALRASDVESGVGTFAVSVQRAWSYSQSGGFQLKAPKNGHRRLVLLPASVRPALIARVQEVEESVGGDGLLFPGPKGCNEPFSEGELRRVFERCARAAGWPCRPNGRTPKGQVVSGRPAIPWMNLRHHAATWLHERAKFDWADVSRTLGHASVSFTQARYVRPSADAEMRNASSLAEL